MKGVRNYLFKKKSVELKLKKGELIVLLL